MEKNIDKSADNNLDKKQNQTTPRVDKKVDLPFSGNAKKDLGKRDIER